MIAIRVALPHLALEKWRETLLTWLMIISGYLFVVSIPIQGVALHLGQKAVTKGPLAPYNLVALAGNSLTAPIAALLVIGAAFAALYRTNS